MAVVDLFVFTLFLALYTLSFLGGIGRTLAALVTWFGVMVAAAFFTRPLAAGLRELIPAMSRWASELLGLLLVVVLVGLLGIWGSIWSLRATPVAAWRWHGRGSGPMSLLLQALLAMVFAGAVTVSIVMIMTNVIGQLPRDAFGVRLRSEVERARLVPLIRDAEPWVQRVVIDWVPGEPPSLLGGA
ncbi:MAG: hypothetical protein ACK42I_02120 [Thermomicrobium sp.]